MDAAIRRSLITAAIALASLAVSLTDAQAQKAYERCDAHAARTSGSAPAAASSDPAADGARSLQADAAR